MGKRLSTLIISFAIMLIPCISFASATAVLKDGDISIVLESSMDFEEYDGCEEYDDIDFYPVADFWDDSVSVSLVYAKGDSILDIYPTFTKGECKEMYNDYGKEILRTFFEYEFAEYDPEFVYKGFVTSQSYGFARYKLKTDEGYKYAYISSQGNGVLQMFVCEYIYSDDGKKAPESQIKKTDKMVKSFSDEGYFIEVGDSDSSGVFDWIYILLAFVVLFLVIKKSSGLIQEAGREVKTEKKMNTSTDEILKKFDKAKESIKEIKLKTDEESGIKISNTGDSYEKSLYTLYKSGLLTKKELNEMLAKYRRGY